MDVCAVGVVDRNDETIKKAKAFFKALAFIILNRPISYQQRQEGGGKIMSLFLLRRPFLSAYITMPSLMRGRQEFFVRAFPGLTIVSVSAFPYLQRATGLVVLPATAACSFAHAALSYRLASVLVGWSFEMKLIPLFFERRF